MKFTVTVTVTYEQAIEVEAPSSEAAATAAHEQFDPASAECVDLHIETQEAA